MRIHTLAFLLFLQSFVACHQGQENTRPLSRAAIGIQSIAASRPAQENARPSAANIVFQSVDGGHTWQDVSAGLPEDLSVRSVFAGGGEVFLGAETGLYRSSAAPAAPVWRKERFLDKRITNIFPGRSGPYFCSYGNGFFQEIMPGADIWMPVYSTLEDKTVHTILETPDGAVFVGSDSGIFKSADGGQTWKHVFDEGMVLNIVAAGGVLIGGGSRGVLRSTDGGEHWDCVLNENILAKKTGLINDRFVTILGTRDPSKVSPEGITDRLRASADGGKTWQRMEQALFPIRGIYDMDERLSQVRDIYDIIQVGEYLFCSFDAGIFRSSDQGKRWELVLPSTGFFNLAVSGLVIYAVTASGGC